MAEAQAYQPRLKTHYNTVVRDALKEKFNLANAMQVPALEKVVLNMGIGETTQDTKKINSAFEDLQAIAGQRPVITRARNSIAGYKVRENMPLGVKETLRAARMFEFFDRLVTIALPRVRDFRGLNPNSFDGNGNFAMGLKDTLCFRKSITTRSIQSGAWTSSCAPQPMTTIRRANCCAALTFRSQIRNGGDIDG